MSKLRKNEVRVYQNPSGTYSYGFEKKESLMAKETVKE